MVDFEVTDLAYMTSKDEFLKQYDFAKMLTLRLVKRIKN